MGPEMPFEKPPGIGVRLWVGGEALASEPLLQSGVGPEPAAFIRCFQRMAGTDKPGMESGHSLIFMPVGQVGKVDPLKKGCIGHTKPNAKSPVRRRSRPVSSSDHGI